MEVVRNIFDYKCKNCGHPIVFHHGVKRWWRIFGYTILLQSKQIPCIEWVDKKRNMCGCTKPDLEKETERIQREIKMERVRVYHGE